MEERSIFDFTSYKDYLASKVGVKGQRKGLKTSLAKALHCQPTYISQVLNGSGNFNLEQGEKLSEHLKHTRDEKAYFLLLIQKERAGTPALRKFFEEQIEQVLTRRRRVTERLGSYSRLTEEHQSIYYSSWLYAAVHIALTVPSLQSRAEISRFLGVPERRVAEALEFLERCGLAIKEQERFRPGPSQILLGNDSRNIIRHHTNWRMKALDSLEREDLTDLHYSSVVSLSREDVARIQDILLQSLQQGMHIVRDSNEEEVFGLCVDFFSLKR